jgi:hypothetical protein
VLAQFAVCSSKVLAQFAVCGSKVLAPVVVYSSKVPAPVTVRCQLNSQFCSSEVPASQFKVKVSAISSRFVESIVV